MNEIAEGIIVETEFEGVNVGVVITDDILIYIDAPTFPRDARFWSAQIERLFPGRVRFLILTDYNGDRILNSRWLQAPLICHKETAEKINGYDKRYPQYLLDSLRRRNPSASKELSSSPVDKASLSFDSRIIIHSASFDIFLDSKPGPTSGNIWVQIPEFRLIFSGDTVVCDQFPPLSEMCSHGWLRTLKEFNAYNSNDYRVIPGRGSITEPAAAGQMADFIRDMRQAVIKFIETDQPYEKIGEIAGRFMPMFPRAGLPEEWLAEDITQGLQRIYNECLETDQSQF